MQATPYQSDSGVRAATMRPPLDGSVSAICGRKPSNRNLLLAALPDEEFRQLQPMLEWRRWPAGTVIQNSGFAARYVYFPVSGIVSVMSTTECGAGVEVAMVGNDGLLGIGTFLGGEPAASRSEVQFAACGYRVPAPALLRRFDDGGALRDTVLRYTQAFITQAAQSVVCIKCHSVEQRLCSWLLSSLDRLCANELPVSHCRIGAALGVRREAVSRATKNLHAAGLLDCGRAMICVPDRAELESRACECYATVKQSIARLMSPPHPRSRIGAAPFHPLQLRAGAFTDRSRSEFRGLAT